METKLYLILFGVFVLNFWRGIFCGYVVDDNVMFPLAQACKKILKENNKSLFAKLPYLHTLFYGAGLFKDNRIDHALNLLIHFACCCLVLVICGDHYTGLLAALFYLLSPVNNQTALWLNGRRYAFSTLCVLLCWKFNIVALFFFAAWLHVSAIALPIMFLVTGHFWLAGIMTIGGAVCGFKRISGIVKSRLSEFAQHGKYKTEAQNVCWGKVIIYVKSVGFYFWHCLLPFKPRMYHEFLYYFGRYKWGNKQGYNALDLDFAKGCAALAILACTHSFWGLWFLVFISQYCGVYTLTMQVADRYLCVAGVGLYILLAQQLCLLPIDLCSAASTGLIVFYVSKWGLLFRAYRNYKAFLRYHISLEPQGVEARSVLGVVLFNDPKPDPMSAFAVLKEGLQYRPNDFKLCLGMAQALFMLGQLERGLKMLDMAEKQVPLGDEEDCKREFEAMRRPIEHQINLEKMMKGKVIPGKQLQEAGSNR